MNYVSNAFSVYCTYINNNYQELLNKISQAYFYYGISVKRG